MLAYKIYPQGLSGILTQAMCKDVLTGIVAAGTTQATATSLTYAKNYVGTVASGTGVVLDVNASTGDEQLIYNGGANPLKVYPDLGSQINGLGNNNPMILPINTEIRITQASSTQWSANLSA